MLEHQVGGAVQGDCRLAGSGTALDDEHLVDRSADDQVLLGLDRRHDLTHGPGALGADLGEHRIGDAAGDIGGVGVVEVLVEVGSDFALVEGEAPAQGDTERVGAGRPVERRSNRRPPVDDDGVVVVVLDVPAPEVPALGAATIIGIDAAEEVAGTGAAQVGEGLGDRHLDVFGGDLVGGALRIDALEPLDHPVAGSPGERQARPFAVELRKHGHRGRSMLPLPHPSVIRSSDWLL